MADKHKVLVCDKLSESGLKILRKSSAIKVDVKTGMSPEELIKTIPGYEGIIIRSGTKVTKAVLDAASKLKIIGRAGAGVDNVDINAASKKGVAVENTPGGNTVTTAEHTIALLCAVARNIPQGTASVKSGKWDRKLSGVELMGKTLGVVGMGRVGSIVASRAQGFKMRCIAFDPYISQEKVEELGVELVSLDDLWKRADFISVHSPLTPQTKHMISTEQFKKMKKGVRIINCARGGIIDEAALAEAIKSGQVAGAALDVFENEPPDENNPLIALPEVICTPHLGASTGEAQENVAIAVARQMVSFFEYGLIENAVNVPAVDPELLKSIGPYLTLAEKMGSFLAQISEGGTKEIEIASSGEIADIDMKPLATSVLRGFLACIIGEEINFVNAPFVAEERGIEVKTTVSHKAHDFTGLLSVKVVSDKGEHSLGGTIFGKKEPRIVYIDGIYIEAEPEGNMLVFTNYDKPGVIGHLGTYLASKKINIGQFRLGRTGPKKHAMSIVNIDEPLTREMLDDIRKIPDIMQAWMIKI
jgi:D-3-phosphoglycerate dehydrogenase